MGIANGEVEDQEGEPIRVVGFGLGRRLDPIEKQDDGKDNWPSGSFGFLGCVC